VQVFVCRKIWFALQVICRLLQKDIDSYTSAWETKEDRARRDEEVYKEKLLKDMKK